MGIFNETNETFIYPGSCAFLEEDLKAVAPRVGKIVALLVLGFFGICGNIFIFILAAKRNVRHNLHYLILNMVSADILVIILDLMMTLPDLFGFRILGVNPFWDEVICKGRTFTFVSALLVSLITLFVITIERFRITSKLTTERFKSHSRQLRVIIVASSWVCSMGLSMHELVSREIITINGIRECAKMWSTYYGVSVALVVSIGFVIFSMILLLSIITLRRLSRRSNDVLRNLPDGQREKRRKQLLDAVKMILFSLLLYLCCYIPWGSFQVFNIVFNYVVNIHEPLPCNIDWSTMDFILSYFLPMVNSSFSPCIYIIFLSHFRKETKRLLCKPISAATGTFTITSRNSSTPAACDNIALSDR